MRHYLYAHRVARDDRPDVADSLRGLVRRYRTAARMARTEAERAFYLRGLAGALAWLAEIEPQPLPSLPLRAGHRRRSA